ncbi:hypothetical protein R3P38DRAFT_2805194 [Favolaschia claudopus]|uniref:Nephrocystin 3-like N-terminal domain-containing protein n=1 Tax=Favolaschia claudopus TaxID=2862362 RepID=A0AAV9ZN39_9AGAR
MKGQQEMDHKIVKLVEAMAHLYSFAKEAHTVLEKSRSSEEIVSQITVQTVECALLIREYSGNTFLGRLARTPFSRAGEKIQELTDALLKLQDDFDRGIVVQNVIKSADILKQTDELEYFNLLSRLRQANTGPSPCQCLPDTRTTIIQDIAQQLMAPSATSQIVWLNGVAGSGKSNIATSISEYFRKLKRLGAVFSFARNDVADSDPTVVLHSIVFGLAMANSHIKEAVCTALKSDINLVKAPLDQQFEELLRHPLDSVKQHLIGPIVIVMDALDECPAELLLAIPSPGSLEHFSFW